MSYISKAITGQVVKNASLIRHLSAAVPQANNDKNPNAKENKKNFFMIASGIVSGFVVFNIYKRFTSSNLPELPKVSAAIAVSRRTQFNFIADVVDSAAKSLVYIEIQDLRRMDYHTGKPATISNGAGFIVASNGLILTNAHVVINKPKSSVSVRLSDGRIFMANVEAIDPVSDLATLRINCINLPALKLGDSATLRNGEFVVALGSPLSLSNTVTAGVVSSTQRHSQELGLHGRDINYIQTDAAITFGNSGGPLVNLDGEAIGINSMKVIPGISFAIPINYAKSFLMLADEKVKENKGLKPPVRRYMGITMVPLTPEILAVKVRGSAIPDTVQSGVLVFKVIMGSPAHTSGLMDNDIIININGNNVTQSSDIYSVLSSNVKVLNMICIRNGQIVKIFLTPEDPE